MLEGCCTVLTVTLVTEILPQHSILRLSIAIRAVLLLARNRTALLFRLSLLGCRLLSVEGCGQHYTGKRVTFGRVRRINCDLLERILRVLSFMFFKSCSV